MRIVLDECLPARLARHLPGHDVTTVPRMGWASVKNGKLLGNIETATPPFDVFITVDQHIPDQQNLSMCSFGIIILISSSNRLNDLLPLVPIISVALADIQVGEVRRITSSPASLFADQGTPDTTNTTNP